jgi:hypothetical protein
MTRGKSILGALALCALSICAFAAANASAEGLTAYTCTNGPVGESTYKDNHCKEDLVGKTGNFETKDIGLNTTAVTFENVGVSILKSKIALANIEIECKKAVSEEAWIQNKTTGTNMEVVGEGYIHYTECSLPKFPKCTVSGSNGGAVQPSGTITTYKLKAATNVMAAGTEEHTVTFTPAGATPFVKLHIVKSGPDPCTIEGTFDITGSASGHVPTEAHSHITFNGKGALKLGAAVAEYFGTTRTTMKEGTESKTIGIKTS